MNTGAVVTGGMCFYSIVYILLPLCQVGISASEINFRIVFGAQPQFGKIHNNIFNTFVASIIKMIILYLIVLIVIRYNIVRMTIITLYS